MDSCYSCTRARLPLYCMAVNIHVTYVKIVLSKSANNDMERVACRERETHKESLEGPLKAQVTGCGTSWTVLGDVPQDLIILI